MGKILRYINETRPSTKHMAVMKNCQLIFIWCSNNLFKNKNIYL